MKTREEKYSSLSDFPKRTTRNKFLYEKIYDEDQEIEDNITVIDNVNEINIDKIKEMIGNREGYQKVRQYRTAMDISETKEKTKVDIDLDEIENKKYDINEILQQRKSNKHVDFEEERIKKISDTQHDILKSLNIKSTLIEEEDEEKLKEMINTIVDEKIEAATLSKTNFDFFEDLRENDCEKEKEVREEFYSSEHCFKEEDFETKEKTKKSGDLLFKIIIGVLSILIVVVILFIISIL